MALGSVSARVQGDIFQGMFFWYCAAPLLKTGTSTKRVIFEHDAAAGVDDVAVIYDPPHRDGAEDVDADFYQCKFHVDRSDAYTSDGICDPAFVGRKTSLLQGFHQAYEKLKGDYPRLRLHLVSNWSWGAHDPLNGILREWSGGALPESFYSAGPRSKLGRVRDKWRDHLQLDSVAFEEFARRLRFGVDHLARPMFINALNGVLACSGLRELSASVSHNPYDSLYQQLVTARRNTFEADSLRALCLSEKLFAEPTGPPEAEGPRDPELHALRREDGRRDRCFRLRCREI